MNRKMPCLEMNKLRILRFMVPMHSKNERGLSMNCGAAAPPRRLRLAGAWTLHELLKPGLHRLQLWAKACEPAITNPFLHHSERLAIARYNFRSGWCARLRQQIVRDHVVRVGIGRRKLLQFGWRAPWIQQVTFQNRPLLR